MNQEKSNKFFDNRRIIDRETAISSNPNDRWKHPLYLEIEAMGWDAVPLMIMDMKIDHWHFWGKSLREITGHKPDYPNPGRVKEMCDYWYEWGQENVDMSFLDGVDLNCPRFRYGCSWEF